MLLDMSYTGSGAQCDRAGLMVLAQGYRMDFSGGLCRYLCFTPGQFTNGCVGLDPRSAVVLFLASGNAKWMRILDARCALRVYGFSGFGLQSALLPCREEK
jgi:hypothetical protein